MSITHVSLWKPCKKDCYVICNNIVLYLSCIENIRIDKNNNLCFNHIVSDSTIMHLNITEYNFYGIRDIIIYTGKEDIKSKINYHYTDFSRKCIILSFSVNIEDVENNMYASIIGENKFDYMDVK